MADIAQTENADHPLALVHHRQSADLELFHVPHGFGKVIVLPAAMNTGGHHITCRSAADIEIRNRQAPTHDVTTPKLSALGH